LENILHSVYQFRKFHIEGFCPGDQHYFKSTLQHRLQSIANCPQTPSDKISIHSAADRFPGDQRDSPCVIFPAGNHQHNKRVGIGFSKTPHPLDIVGPGQAKPAFHPFTLFPEHQHGIHLAFAANRMRLTKAAGPALPADPLYVIIH
jgi:hypothetical protein